jgi:hypothetical protein
MIYNLFLDDQRNPKDVSWVALPLVQWTIVRNYKQFVDTVTRLGIPSRVTFDHDLADEHYKEFDRCRRELLIGDAKKFQYEKMNEKTGYDCAKWLANYCVDKNIPIPEYYVHTLNGIGAANIFSILESARKVIMASVCQKCGSMDGTPELHDCPYDSDINNDSTPCCNCCPKCCQDCANEI